MITKRADQIADTLEELIFRGQFKDGDRLDEIKLAESYNVSRTPIREALLRLVHSGMAEQIPRRGVFVRQPGPVELLEMFETMAELEAACGRFAAKRMPDEGITRLLEANARCARAVERNDSVSYYAENEAFHQEIYRGTTNGFLESEALRLQNRLKPYRRMQLNFRGRMIQSLAEHDAIILALQAGDDEATAKALRGHVAVQGEKFQQLMSTFKD